MVLFHGLARQEVLKEIHFNHAYIGRDRHVHAVGQGTGKFQIPSDGPDISVGLGIGVFPLSTGISPGVIPDDEASGLLLQTGAREHPGHRQVAEVVQGPEGCFLLHESGILFESRIVGTAEIQAPPGAAVLQLQPLIVVGSALYLTLGNGLADRWGDHIDQTMHGV